MGSWLLMPLAGSWTRGP